MAYPVQPEFEGWSHKLASADFMDEYAWLTDDVIAAEDELARQLYPGGGLEERLACCSHSIVVGTPALRNVPVGVFRARYNDWLARQEETCGTCGGSGVCDDSHFITVKYGPCKCPDCAGDGRPDRHHETEGDNMPRVCARCSKPITAGQVRFLGADGKSYHHSTLHCYPHPVETEGDRLLRFFSAAGGCHRSMIEDRKARDRLRIQADHEEALAIYHDRVIADVLDVLERGAS